MSSSSAPTGSDTVRANDPYENSERPFDSLGLGPLGLDRQLSVADGDLDVLDRVDSGKFGADLVEPFAGLVLQAQQIVVEERTQAGDRRQVGERRKASEKLLKSSDSSGSKGRD